MSLIQKNTSLAGILQRHLAAMTVVGVIAKPGETPERVEAGQAGEAPKEAAKPAKAAAAAKDEPQAAPTEIIASPAAKRVAKELGVDLAKVKGTGPGGRIKEDDVTKYHENASKKPKITPLAEVLAEQAGLDLWSLTGTGEGGKITKADVERALNPETAATAEAPAAEGGVKVVPMSCHREMRPTEPGAQAAVAKMCLDCHGADQAKGAVPGMASPSNTATRSA